MTVSYRKNTLKNRDGAMLPYVAIVLIVLFVAAVFAIDIASIHVVRSELRTATDAAAKAAVEALGREQSRQAAIDAALRIAEANTVAGEGLILDPNEIRFGASIQNNSGAFEFSEGATPVNSVRVTGERTADSPSGSVGLFFAPILGRKDFEPVQTATATRLDRDIALVLDVSGSMSINGRFGALQNALDVFLAELELTSQKENLSLTVYNELPRKIQDMTTDFDLIRNGFASESPGGFTGIGRGLEFGLDSVLNDTNSREFSLKSVIVMTDGNQNRGISPEIVAQQAGPDGIVVHTITFSPGANQALMEQVANVGGGIHLHAETNDELVDAFQTIARQLQVLLIE